MSTKRRPVGTIYPGHAYENSAWSTALSATEPEGGEIEYEFNLTTGGNPGLMFAIDNAPGSGGTLRLAAAVDFETLKNQSFYTRRDRELRLRDGAAVREGREREQVRRKAGRRLFLQRQRQCPGDAHRGIVGDDELQRE
jgi:hypothetical protein